MHGVDALILWAISLIGVSLVMAVVAWVTHGKELFQDSIALAALFLMFFGSLIGFAIY